MKNTTIARHVAAATLPLALLACGGGSDSPATTTPTALSISGTAATGAAIVGGQVEVKCAAGNGSTTTLADGSYTVTISGGSLPCMMRVTTGSAELYSLSEDNGGSSVRANITPFTSLVASQIVGGDLKNVYDAFQPSEQTKITAATVASAITAVTDALKGVVDLSGVNPLTATFVIGDPLDQQLDAFKAALDKAGTTLGEVTDTLAGGGSPATQTLLQPVAPTCAGLRSGRYRAINPNETDPQWANHVFQLDADTLKVTFWDGSTNTLVDNGGCSFTVDTTQLLVSKSGLTIARDTLASGQTEVTLILPEQTIALSELAGTWNSMGYARDAAGAALHPTAATYTLDAAGKFSAGADCAGLAACTAWSATPGDLKASSGGGFEYTDASGATQRVFAFRTADGLMLLRVRPNQTGFSVATQQRTLSLPALGTVNNVWDFTLNGSGYASALDEMTITVTAVDSATQSYTRQRESNGRIDSFTVNSPRDGLRYRAAGTSPTNSGGTVSFSEIIAMPLPKSMGVTVYTSVAANQNFFGVSIAQP